MANVRIKDLPAAELFDVVSDAVIPVDSSENSGRTLGLKLGSFYTKLFHPNASPALIGTNGIEIKVNNASVPNFYAGLVPATTSSLGGVRPDGTTITVDSDGIIRGASTYTLPTATADSLGGVKIDGTTITINDDGVITAITAEDAGTRWFAGETEPAEGMFAGDYWLCTAQGDNFCNVYKYSTDWSLLVCNIRGAAGTDGISTTVKIGEVTTVPYGQAAAVTNVGTDTDVILDIAIPRGANGSEAITVSDLYTLRADGWVNNEQKVTIPLQIDKRNVIDITPNEIKTWGNSAIYPINEETTGITFKCDTVPTSDLTFRVTMMEVNL